MLRIPCVVLEPPDPTFPCNFFEVATNAGPESTVTVVHGQSGGVATLLPVNAEIGKLV